MIANAPLQHVPHLWTVQKIVKKTEHHIYIYNLYIRIEWLEHNCYRHEEFPDPPMYHGPRSPEISPLFSIGLGRIIGSDKHWSSLGLELCVVLVDLQKRANTSHMIWQTFQNETLDLTKMSWAKHVHGLICFQEEPAYMGFKATLANIYYIHLKTYLLSIYPG